MVIVEFRELLFEKSVEVDTDNSYVVGLDFMKKLSERYFVYERKNTFETDGPTKRSVLVFDVIENIDKFSQVVFSFQVEGENDALYINVKAEFVVRIREYGFFTDAFAEFYLGSVFPVLQKASQGKVKELEQQIERL